MIVLVCTDHGLVCTLLQFFDPLKPNWNAKINRDLPYRVSEIFEGKAWVIGCINNDNEATTSSHHLIKAQILEVASIREIDIFSIVRGHSECLFQQRQDGPGRSVVLVGCTPLECRIAQPPPETNVEHGHEKRHGR